jgi:hypothetical protein
VIFETTVLEKETDELEVILKYCEEIAGKVFDITDRAAEVNYRRNWSDVEPSEHVFLLTVHTHTRTHTFSPNKLM